ncbi:squalene/phytoene synthase family protein [Streptomyces rimosus]|uniref:squalene/phytoene synthase family protein n=1 Tax=Streptomyces rimosus TaxID=1927 RepID=UPI000A4C19EB|nr:squalene/phytoene synthase family protein [Streptomyces rimosus]
MTAPGLPLLRRLLPQATPWQYTLNLAEIPRGRLRDDYTAASALAARRYPALYGAARLLIPPAWQPHLFAGGAFAVYADCLADVPVHQCDPAVFHAWAEQVRQGLDTGRAEQSFLRAFLYTVQVLSIDHADVHAALAGQAVRTGLTGYATEQDHHDHIELTVMPGARVMLAACRIPPCHRNETAMRLCLDAGQRWDDLADLAADLRRGFLTIPETDLLHFHVTRGDLEAGRDTPAVRALLAHACGKARAAFDAARAALDDADPAVQFLTRPVLMLTAQGLRGLEHQGAALLRPSRLWSFRLSPTELIGGTLRTLHHRLHLT